MVLAERHPLAHLAPPHNDASRPLFYQWMVFLTNMLQPTYLRWYYPDRVTSDANGVAAVRDKAHQDLVAIWSRLDGLLDKGPFLLGERFSGADLMLQMLSSWRDPLPDILDRWRNVKACVEAVEARPAVQRMLKQNRPA
jgi:glutathione S-transferase